jgi:hypothetical protein
MSVVFDALIVTERICFPTAGPGQWMKTHSMREVIFRLGSRLRRYLNSVFNNADFELVRFESTIVTPRTVANIETPRVPGTGNL